MILWRNIIYKIIENLFVLVLTKSIETTPMDLINKYNSWIQEVENYFTNPINPSDTIEGIDQVIRLYYIHSKLDYSVKRKRVDEFKIRYIGSDGLESDAKLHSMLKWELGLEKSNASFPISKSILIQFVNKLNPEYFIPVFGLIKNGTIKFNLNEIKQLSIEFFSHIGSNLIHRINKTNSDQDYLEKSNLEITPLESFFTNGLVSIPFDQPVRSNMIKGIGWMCGSSSLEYAPSGRVKKFTNELDLIKQITQFYSENLTSPFVSFRTNVGIIINNSSWEFYQLDKYIGFAKKISCSEFTVEFPYMCWVWPEYIQIEYTKGLGSSTEFKPIVKPGYDYLLKPFKSVPYKENLPDDKSCSETKKVCKIEFTQEEKASPCAYIRIHVPNYEKIVGIQVFGQALSLI
jgi:hypothetical protein